MIPIPLSHRALRSRTLRHGRHVAGPAALFPFFRADGTVTHLMIVLHGDSDIHFVEHQPGRFRVPLVGPVRTEMPVDHLPRIEQSHLPVFRTLWHHDPWRMLEDPRFADHWAVSPLKATNCADILERADISQLYFRRDLSRIVWYILRQAGDSSLKRWAPAVLPARRTGRKRAVTVPPGAGDPWILDPIWKRWERT